MFLALQKFPDPTMIPISNSRNFYHGLLYLLFDKIINGCDIMNEPLAVLLRPTKTSEIIGQKHLVGENKILSSTFTFKSSMSLVLVDIFCLSAFTSLE